jgi:exosortase H (IPTLxxWG-CTERM-specific)
VLISQQAGFKKDLGSLLFGNVLGVSREDVWVTLGIGAGILAVQALNVVRVVSLFYLGQWNTRAFEWAHLYLWQALIMLDVLVVWMVWIRALRLRPGPA